MTLDHDPQNVPRLSDDDREALNDDYSVAPALVGDEALAMCDDNGGSNKTTEGEETHEVPANPLVDDTDAAQTIHQCRCALSYLARERGEPAPGDEPLDRDESYGRWLLMTTVTDALTHAQHVVGIRDVALKNLRHALGALGSRRLQT
jgi:hypothetical protein